VSSTSTGSVDVAAPAFVIDGDCLRLVLDTTVYRLAAIQKAGYRLAQRFTLAVGSPEGTRLPLMLMLPPGASVNAAELVEGFYRELCDQELRESIADQTKDVRALLLAHAFSRTDLVRRE
jgi:His-Xaa-Ser system protein HxsD